MGRGSGDLGIWGSGMWDVGAGDLGMWGSGDLGMWGSGDLGIWGCGIWGSGDLGIWGSGDLGIWGSGDLGIWGSGGTREAHRGSGRHHGSLAPLRAQSRVACASGITRRAAAGRPTPSWPPYASTASRRRPSPTARSTTPRVSRTGRPEGLRYMRPCATRVAQTFRSALPAGGMPPRSPGSPAPRIPSPQIPSPPDPQIPRSPAPQIPRSPDPQSHSDVMAAST